MLFQPFNRLIIFSVHFLLRRLNTPSNLITLFTSLFTLSTILISSVGILPTLRVFWNLRQVTHRNTNLRVFLSRVTNLDPFILGQVIDVITPYYKDCLDNLPSFKRINWIIISYFILRMFRPNLFYILRFSIGAMFSSVGILWNETLSSIEILKDFALFTKDILETHLNFKIPFISKEKILDVQEVTTPVTDQDKETSSKWFTILGVVTLGIFGTITVLFIGDILQPELTSHIPYVRTILDPIYNFIANYYYPSDSSSDSVSSSASIICDAMSRSSSGESTVMGLPLPANLLTPCNIPDTTDTTDAIRDVILLLL